MQNQKETSPTGAVKFDANKEATELVPPEAILAIGAGYEYGRQKYSANNWRKGLEYSRLIGSLLRHIYKWSAGETYDQESGIHHLALAGCSLTMLLSYELDENSHGLDDRSKVALRPYMLASEVVSRSEKEAALVSDLNLQRFESEQNAKEEIKRIRDANNQCKQQRIEEIANKHIESDKRSDKKFTHDNKGWNPKVDF